MRGWLRPHPFCVPVSRGSVRLRMPTLRYGRQLAPCRLFALAAVVLPTRCWESASAKVSAPEPLLGEYGFLTQFTDIPEAEARMRIRRMWEVFRVLEFQFYDAFEGYSRPPQPVFASWVSSFGRRVDRGILRAYIDEIRKIGGRSWLYVQAMATDPNDTAAHSGMAVAGQHYVDGQPLLDVVVTNAAWADRIAGTWAEFAASMGFSGIHWDTLGDRYHVSRQGADLPGFLRHSNPVLRRHGLLQTCNFVDGYGWDRSLFGGPSIVGNVIAFPYWEAWSLPAQEDVFFKEVAPQGGGVFACYPGKSPSHAGEDWNKNAKGIWPIDLLILRWQKSRCHASAYLAIGDGSRHIQDEYFPNAALMNEKDVTKVRNQVFRACTFHNKTPKPYHQNSSSWPWVLFSCLVGILSFVAGRYSHYVGRLGSLYGLPFGKQMSATTNGRQIIDDDPARKAHLLSRKSGGL